MRFLNKLFLIGALITSSMSFVNAQELPTYCKPTVVLPQNYARATTQSMYITKVLGDDDAILMEYTDPDPTKAEETKAQLHAYRWVNDDYNFEVKQNQTIKVDVHSGIWTNDIVILFDWDRDGVFETKYRAFGKNIDAPGTGDNSSWADEYKDKWSGDKRREIEKEKGNSRDILTYVFEVTVPADASLGKSVMRVICDGDGRGGDPVYKPCESVGYAGSMADFGVTVSEATPPPPAIEVPDYDPTITLTTNYPESVTSSDNPGVKLHLYSSSDDWAIVDWGDGSPIEKVTLKNDPDKPNDAQRYKGQEVIHRPVKDNAIIKIWAPTIEGIVASSNRLTNVDFNNATKLKRVSLDKNHEMQSIDVSGLPSLIELHMENNKGLQNIVLGNHDELKEIECYKTGISSLDVSKFPKLENLSCEENPNLKNIVFGDNKQLKTVFVYGSNYDACELDAIYKALPEMDSKDETNKYPALLVVRSGFENEHVEKSSTKVATDKNWYVREWKGDEKEIVGDGSECKSTSINSAVVDMIRVSPNPTSDYINVTLPNDITSILRIYSVSGELVYERFIDGSASIDVSSWNKGMYILNVLDNTFKVVVK